MDHSNQIPPPPPPSGYPPVPGNPYDRELKRRQRRAIVSDSVKGVIIGIGLFIFTVSFIIFIATYSTAHECSSGLVYALDQSTCMVYSMLHSLSIGGGVLSVIGILAAILIR